MEREVIIIGGGLAGLINAILLANAGLDVLVIEKKVYPFHKVCGEYISNEVLPFLKSLQLDPDVLEPSCINNLQVTSPSGIILEMPLELGGFGISRYELDNFLYQKAKDRHVKFLLNTTVTDVSFEEDMFTIHTNKGEIISSKLVIGSFGKRANLDRQFHRKFFYKRSPYIGVKYHIKADYPNNLISLHNFKDGYCGVVKIEKDLFNICYLTTRENLRIAGDIPTLEKSVLQKNPFLLDIFTNSDFLNESPEVINEISFEPKTIVDHHLLMSGDAAGMITPLCGNGMAMAIHSAKILSELIIKYYKKQKLNRELLEAEYASQWKKIFDYRLSVGRKIQRMFGNETLTDISLRLLKRSGPIKKWLVRQTHGEVF